MKITLTAHEEIVIDTIAEWAGTIHIDGGPRAEKKARNAAQALAEDIAAIAMFPLPKANHFRNLAGQRAAEHVRRYS